MNDSFKLSIAKPCQEKFSTFQPTLVGGFCNSCQKEVIDFTRMTDDEIREYFKTATKRTCGRFSESQLKAYTSPAANNSTFSPFSVGTGMLGISLLSIMPFAQANGQDQPQTITSPTEQQQNPIDERIPAAQIAKDSLLTGFVKDAKSGESIPFANVVLSDNSAGTSTDFDGKFTFPKPLKEGDVLVISFTGYETIYHTISNTATINLLMFEDEGWNLSEVITIMGEVSFNEVYTSKRTFWQKLKSFFS